MLRGGAAPVVLLLLGAAAVVVQVEAVCQSRSWLAVQNGLWGVSGATLEDRTQAPAGTNVLVVRD